ncbi:fimbria/pilus periplasmic chaperone [Burkholderia pyrrocinia]|uniref:Fimbria/pilus periplasmic chaperone n=1 Tax=Burkholderia pyrrocinia TaxID=60550 RepID=A0ABZ3BN86_BURPY
MPFAVTPPVARIDSSKGHVENHLSRRALPQDRESVVWINVLKVPPKPAINDSDADANRLELVFRSRIKLF